MSLVLKKQPEEFINSLTLLLTNNCNLSCKYCYEEHDKEIMSNDVIEASINFLYETNKNNKQPLSLLFFGGEPTLNVKGIKYAFEYSEKMCNLYKKNISISMITNTTIFTDEMYNIFHKYKNLFNFNVQLSIDGKEETQLHNRPCKNGMYDYSTILNNIKKYKILFKENPYNLNIHGCLNKFSIRKLYENFIYFKEDLGIDRIWFCPIMNENWNNDDLVVYYKEYEKIYEYIFKDISKTFDILSNVSPLDKAINCGSYNSKKPCGAGVHYLTVSPDGEIFPCHQLYFTDKKYKYSILGYIDKGIDEYKKMLFQRYCNDDLLFCDKTCSHKSTCYRCVAANYQINGSIFSQIKGNYCKLQKIDEFFQNKIRKGLIDHGITR